MGKDYEITKTHNNMSEFEQQEETLKRVKKALRSDCQLITIVHGEREKGMLNLNMLSRTKGLSEFDVQDILQTSFNTLADNIVKEKRKRT